MERTPEPCFSYYERNPLMRVVKLPWRVRSFRGKKKKHRTEMITGTCPRPVCLTHAHTCQHTQTGTDSIF